MKSSSSEAREWIHWNFSKRLMSHCSFYPSSCVPIILLASMFSIFVDRGCSWLCSTSIHWFLRVKELLKSVCLLGGFSMQTTWTPFDIMFSGNWDFEITNFLSKLPTLYFCDLISLPLHMKGNMVGTLKDWMSLETFRKNWASLGFSRFSTHPFAISVFATGVWVSYFLLFIFFKSFFSPFETLEKLILGRPKSGVFYISQGWKVWRPHFPSLNACSSGFTDGLSSVHGFSLWIATKFGWRLQNKNSSIYTILVFRWKFISVQCNILRGRQ